MVQVNLIGEPPKRPLSYTVVSLSLYHDDLRRLDELVAEVKKRHPSASRSSVVRLLTNQADPAQLAASYRRGI